jgi:hypothetical protein
MRLPVHHSPLEYTPSAKVPREAAWESSVFTYNELDSQWLAGERALAAV